MAKEDIQNKTIAIIGGAGFVGHHLAIALAQIGCKVHVIDSLQVNNLGALYSSAALDVRGLYIRILHERLELMLAAKIHLHVIDARDYHKTSFALNDIKPDIIVHLAAVAHANVSNKDPHSTFDHSLRTLENVLDASRGSIKQFIYLSSSMIYGNFTAGEVTEESACEPIGIYGALKFAGEKIVIGYHQVFGLPYTIIRPSAIYGQRCISRRVGQIFIESALRGHEINIQGDGGDKLDFTYIKDFIDGLILTMGSDAAKNQIFNITYGVSRSLNEMANLIKKHFAEARICYQERDRLMPKRGTLSIDKMKRLLGYAPKFHLEKGMDEYIRWYNSMELANDHSFIPMVVE